MRFASWASAAAAALLLAGCGKTAEQLAAIHDVRAKAGPTATTVRCSRSASAGPFAGTIRTKLFVCVARFRGGGCKAYLARRRDDGFSVSLYPRDQDCTVPP